MDRIVEEYTEYERRYFLEEMDFYIKDKAYMERLKKEFPNLREAANQIISMEMSVIYGIAQKLEDIANGE